MNKAFRVFDKEIWKYGAVAFWNMHALMVRIRTDSVKPNYEFIVDLLSCSDLEAFDEQSEEPVP